MNSTPVRDVGSMLANMAAAKPGKSAETTGGFQAVWNNQMNKGTEGDLNPGSSVKTSEKQNTCMDSSVDAQQEEPIKPQDGQSVQDNGENIAEPVMESAENAGSMQENPKTEETQGFLEMGSQPEELTTEELEQVMEVLGAAALNLMQQIADAFNLSMEELQAVMDELGMAQTDVLQTDALGSLLLKLGGAEDAYALIMNESLYDNYRMLMEQMGSVLEESSKELELEPGQLEEILEKFSSDKAVEPEMTMTVPVEIPKQAAAESNVQESKMDVVTPQETQNVLDVQQQESNGQAQEQQPEQTKENGRQDVGKSSKEQHENVFVQDLRPGQFQSSQLQTQAPQVDSVLQNSGWSADTRNIMGQIMDYMKLQLNADTTSLEMQLHPASLGTLQVQIDSRAGMLTAHFITQNEAVKAALESQIVQLQENFQEQGVKVEAIEVTVQTHEFEQNLEQGRERGQQEPEKKNRTRRINLNDSFAMESMEEEDALAADIMVANGNTVDYTA